VVYSLVRYFPSSVVGVTGISSSVSRLVLSHVSSSFIGKACFNFKQLMTVALCVIVSDDTHGGVPFISFGFQDVSVDLVLDLSSVLINVMSDLVRVGALEVLHVLGVVNMAVTDATDLTVSSVIVLG
jgi:hypothetical protein